LQFTTLLYNFSPGQILKGKEEANQPADRMTLQLIQLAFSTRVSAQFPIRVAPSWRHIICRPPAGFGIFWRPQSKEEDTMEAIWWTLGILAIVLYTLWVASAFNKKTDTPARDEKK
jgi:hypothetical protein